VVVVMVACIRLSDMLALDAVQRKATVEQERFSEEAKACSRCSLAIWEVCFGSKVVALYGILFAACLSEKPTASHVEHSESYASVRNSCLRKDLMKSCE
jgi:hypothetical protein